MRSIHFSDLKPTRMVTSVWKYKIGRSFIDIRYPTGEKHLVRKTRFFELQGHEEVEAWRKSLDDEELEITPSMIKKYIEDNLKE